MSTSSLGFSGTGSGSGSGGGGLDLLPSSLVPFLDPDFDADEYARACVASAVRVDESLERLKSSVGVVETAIRRHVAKNNDSLMKALNSGEGVKENVKTLHSRAIALKDAVESTKDKFSGVHDQLKADVCELRNAQETCRALRKILRITIAVKRLKVQLASVKQGKPTSREHAKSALLLREIETLLEGDELKGVEFVDNQRPFVASIGESVRVASRDALNGAIESLNQSEIGTALQAFFNLDCLPGAVDNAVAWCVESLGREVSDALNVELLAAAVDEDNAKHGRKKKSNKGAKRPPSGQSKIWKRVMWSRFAGLVDKLQAWCLRVWNLDRVLGKKRRDPATHVVFADVIAPPSPRQSRTLLRRSSSMGARRGAYASFWPMAVKLIASSFEDAAKMSPFIRNMLIQEYPRLRMTFGAMLRRLTQSTSGKAVPVIGNAPSESEALMHTMRPYLEVYLARSVSRLKEPIEMMMPSLDNLGASGSGTVDAEKLLPTPNDLETLTKVIQNELQKARRDVPLAVALCSGVCTALTTFCSRVETYVRKESSTQSFHLLITGHRCPKTSGQNYCTSICAIVLKLADLVSAILVSDAASTAEEKNNVQKVRAALQPGIDALHVVVEGILGEYFAAMAEAVHSIVAMLHEESFFIGDGAGLGERSSDITESKFMSRFEKAIDSVVQDHLFSSETRDCRFAPHCTCKQDNRDIREARQLYSAAQPGWPSPHCTRHCAL